MSAQEEINKINLSFMMYKDGLNKVLGYVEDFIDEKKIVENNIKEYATLSTSIKEMKNLAVKAVENPELIKPVEIPPEVIEPPETNWGGEPFDPSKVEEVKVKGL